MNNKFIIPCEPEYYLNLTYGEKWKYHELKSYQENLNWSALVKKDAYDLPYSLRIYNSHGNIDKHETLNRINKYYNPLTGRNLTYLLGDEFDYF